MNFLHNNNLQKFSESCRLASNGVQEGTNRYETGNDNLKSEVSLQGDAVLN